MNFLKRLVTTLFLLPLVIAIIHFGGVVFSLTVTIVGVYLADEIAAMGLGKAHRIRPFLGLASALLMLMVVANFNQHQGFLGLWLFIFLFGLVLTYKPEIPLEEISKIAFVTLICLYGFLGLASLFYLREGVGGDDVVGRSFIYLALVCTFGNDTFAYLIGRWFGKRPLMFRVSQKKTWEGFLAGAVASVVLPFVVSSFFGALEIDVFAGLSLIDLLFVSIGIAVLAPIGDLMESRVKRAFDVKDSGGLLPGHGGLFDRIDALLVTLPFTLGYAFFLRPL